MVDLYRGSRDNAVEAALGAGRKQPGVVVLVMSKMIILDFGRCSLLVPRLQQSQSLNMRKDILGTNLWGRANRSNHLFDELDAHLLASALAHGQGHV